MNSREEIINLYSSQVKNRFHVSAILINERKRKLKIFLDEILRSKTDILSALKADLGKSFTEGQIIEIYPIVKELRHTIKNLERWAKPERVTTPVTLLGSKSRIIKDPKGVVLIISPWNYPFLLSVNPIIHAVAAGNCVILKPSGKSIHTSKMLKELLLKVFPENEIAVVLGDHRDAQTLLELKFDHIFFTGSTSVGKMVMEAAAKNLTPVTLELGGKSPVIIDGTYDIDKTAKRITWGKFINAGQTCIAPDYLLVKEGVEEKIIKSIITHCKNFYEAGDDFSQSKIYPRLISEQHTDKLVKLIDTEKASESEICFGGKFIKNEKFIEPTIFKGVKPDNEIMKEEIFGPILPVITYRTNEEAIDIISRNANPLAMYIFSRNKKFVSEITKNCPSGGVTINDTVLHFANINLPFGGIGNSGIGKSHGRSGFNEFINRRAVLEQSGFSPVSLLYPPYNKWKQKIADLLLKYF